MIQIKDMEPEGIRLFRKRLIPAETVLLDQDTIHFIHKEDNYLVTTWKVIRPRADFAKGCSVYYFSKGIKVSKFFTGEGELLYYYCDIIKSHVENNDLIVTDLLLDVVVYPNGQVKVLDVEELPKAHDLGLLSLEEMKLSLEILGILLKDIENGDFTLYAQPVDLIKSHLL